MGSNGQGFIRNLIEKRLDADIGEYNELAIRAQQPIWELLTRYYFRLEVDGWERLPEPPCLLVGTHSGGALTMDAWTFVYAWWRRHRDDRLLHATAHDVLMALPGLGDYFRAMGVMPAARSNVGEALDQGYDVIVWPGGEKDSMRHWTKRDEAVLGGRTGFVKMALEKDVPIVPVATVGGHDTVFVVAEGQFLARVTGLGEKLRGANAPIVVGPPFGVALETIPMHLPLPAKIRTEILDSMVLDGGADARDDEDYVGDVYDEVESTIQAGMDRLAAKRRFPVFF